MEFNFQKVEAEERYRILGSVVLPRPIAWISTVSLTGVENLAPFSFFNAMGADPAIVAIGFIPRANGDLKDTLRNIAEQGDFAINLVPFSMVQKMNASSAEFPPDVSEITALGLRTVASRKILPPRLAECPVHLECRQRSIITIRSTRIVLGEVLHVHVADDYYDVLEHRVKGAELDLVGRMHGGRWYTRTNDLFKLPRL